MEPKIVFLGTAGDAIVTGKQLRASGGIVIEDGSNLFILDPGPGALVRARQFDINLRNVTSLFVSHNHLNHVNDLNAVISAMTHSGMDQRGVLVCNTTVLNGLENDKPDLSAFHRKCLEKVVVLETGQKVGINDAEIMAIPALHSEPHTIGFKFITPNFTLTYSSDTAYSPHIIEEYKGSDILILNVANPTGVNSDGQFNTDDAIKILKEVKPRLTVITHFGIKMLNADPLIEARIIQKETKCQVIAAKDGMMINPISYSTQIRQKTLNSY